MLTILILLGKEIEKLDSLEIYTEIIIFVNNFDLYYFNILWVHFVKLKLKGLDKDAIQMQLLGVVNIMLS